MSCRRCGGKLFHTRGHVRPGSLLSVQKKMLLIQKLITGDNL